MYTDLFSALDCGVGSWPFILWFLPLPLSFLVFTSKVITSEVNKVHNEIREDLGRLTLFITSLIIFLLVNNLIGLLPFTYGFTTRLWMARGLAISLWGVMFLSGWLKNPQIRAAHLAPAGAPLGLAPVLVLIETVRIIIRPLTLTVRLIANISAGHIVLSLVANCLTRTTGLTKVIVLFLNTGYTMFEVFVCAIQAYIFSLLIKLYTQEHP